MKEQVISMFYELKDAKTGEILESNMQGGNEISFISGRRHIIDKLEEEVLKLEVGDIKTILFQQHRLAVSMMKQLFRCYQKSNLLELI